MKRKSLQERFDEKFIPDPNSGCWLWTAYCNKLGYGTFKLRDMSVHAHRISYQLYRGDITTGLDVLHRCDVRSCVNPSHLFLGTQQDNIRDMVAKNRQSGALGQNNIFSKLTSDQILAIRADQRPQRLVAADYGIDKTHVWRIRTKKAWAHL